MKSLVELREELYIKCALDERKITGLWATDCLYNPMNNGRVFQYKFLVLQTPFGQGCAYSTCSFYHMDKMVQLIGMDCLSSKIEDSALQVACMDALAHKLSYGYSSKIIEIDGKSEDKLHLRSSLIIDEAKRLLGRLSGKKVLNVGVVGDIIKTFIDEGCEVIGTDFDENIIGKTLFGQATIFDGHQTMPLLESVDLAVVTGMTLTTNTLDEIINICKLFSVKLIIFAETGANMGQYYVKRGVDVYIGEKYPFYIFDGKSILEITRKESAI